MYRFLVGLLVLASLGSCKKFSEVEVNGHVRNTSTQQSLDSVIVTLYEDNDGAFMGMHKLQETLTDEAGNFRFKFSYQEGPYKIYVYRYGYRYTRNVTDKFFGLSTTVDYQMVAALDNDQNMVFDMSPEATLNIRLKSVPPSYADDKIRIEVGKSVNGQAPFVREFEGQVEEDVLVGIVEADKFIPIKYVVRENNVWRTVKDSVAVQPLKVTEYQLHY